MNTRVACDIGTARIFDLVVDFFKSSKDYIWLTVHAYFILFGHRYIFIKDFCNIFSHIVLVYFIL